MGLTRATFPFTLVERNQNCTHDGVMAFLFDDQQISHVRYQVTTETCLYRKFDMWGQLPATYRPETIADAGELQARMANELASRIPTRPIESLPRDYPDAGSMSAHSGAASLRNGSPSRVLPPRSSAIPFAWIRSRPPAPTRHVWDVCFGAG